LRLSHRRNSSGGLSSDALIERSKNSNVVMFISRVVVEDEDCLIFAVVEETGRRVVANIRYKMILGFSV